MVRGSWVFGKKAKACETRLSIQSLSMGNRVGRPVRACGVCACPGLCMTTPCLYKPPNLVEMTWGMPH